MNILRLLLRRLRILAGLVATLIFFFIVLLPPVLGLATRQAVVDRVDALQSDKLAEFNIESLSAEAVRSGWFSSEMLISARGPVLSSDGRETSTRTGILHINHGPVMWHLSDSLLALANLQLLPENSGADHGQHFSGSAIVKITPLLAIQIRLIAGINASGGDHWLEMQTNSPLLPLAGRQTRQLWFDLDADALAAAGMGDQIARWQLNEHARVSKDRLLFYIGSQ